jgi:bifunctional non-homologous end joining protein LigD
LDFEIPPRYLVRMLLRTRRPAPGFIQPCLPSRAEQPPSGPGWFHEIKLDGFRLLAHRAANGVRLFTRNGFDWAERYPRIAAAVGKLRCQSCLLDGEVVLCGDDGTRPSLCGRART